MNAAIDFGGGHIQPFYLAFNAVPDGLERFLVVAAFQHNVLAAVSQNFPLTAFVAFRAQKTKGGRAGKVRKSGRA